MLNSRGKIFVVISCDYYYALHDLAVRGAALATMHTYDDNMYYKL